MRAHFNCNLTLCTPYRSTVDYGGMARNILGPNGRPAEEISRPVGSRKMAYKPIAVLGADGQVALSPLGSALPFCSGWFLVIITSLVCA